MTERTGGWAGCLRACCRNLLMANQFAACMLEVRGVIDLLKRQPRTSNLHFLVDSPGAHLAAIESIAAGDPPRRKLAALIELGVPGRWACRPGRPRRGADAGQLARQVAASRSNRSRGSSATGCRSWRHARGCADGRSLMQRVHELAVYSQIAKACSRVLPSSSLCRRRGRLRHRRPRAADASVPPGSSPSRRSGCYVTHDSGATTSACSQASRGAAAANGRRRSPVAACSRRSRCGRGGHRALSRRWRS